ncbi:PREDICTED: transcriptional regulator STERILE APETALA [Nelumbo nucifera]|uniref:Transcriptional regulator STERILE APETALA n=2 Tax=Nelumbo nucifera TaxID=4432 RepID=A0A1U8B2K3_NELNU|nr:PREDICTED: transcriptional regulator STERILE APETALA [Nelumbo nucifera]DAD20249.1 TPA_asm: hypothetical protein HUJ06_021712 [Nelumbo nucifera]
MSSSSSSSSSEGSAEGGGDVHVHGGQGRGGEFERPSSSRQRSGDGVWPEPFVEALAYQVAIDAARTIGRLAAGPAVANVFQVCSTWRAVSRSDLLWHNLTRQIWGADRLQHDTWRDEFISRHRTAFNFRYRRAVYTTLEFDASGNDNDGLICRCLALSDVHLACGFLDGTVRLFDLSSRLHVGTFRPHHRDDLLGAFSRAVSGIILTDTKLVFASLDGDIHVANIHGVGTRRAQLGSVLNDGTLVDFSGCARWWVGLFAGVPGRAFHVWDGDTEELMFVGGSLTDPEAVIGWRLLTRLGETVGRIRVSGLETAVACTGSRVMVFDLQNQGLILGEEEFERGINVNSVDVCNDVFLVVDNRGLASVRRVGSFEEVCRFTMRGGAHRGGGMVLGCVNSDYAFLCSGGVIRVWDVHHGGYLYRLRERMGEATALISDESYVVASSSDATIHLWDFGAL